MPASTSSSPFLKSQLARASTLEQQLQGTTNEQEQSAIRVKLCEAWSEIILKEPPYALRKDAFGRLWRNCFYARITDLRSRISKEKKRKEKSRAITKLEKSLTVFLKEAIELYKYLLHQYQEKLVPSEASQEESQEAVSTEGVVAGMHRIYIYMGDLYRYACDYKEATTHYTKASLLAPSKGNPYNQLAVVAQLSNTEAPLYCVALYYYARSLLATHDPFPTSKGNLERVLQQNCDFLKNTSEESLLQAQTKTYAQKVELQRAKRTVASRLFLARFVDVHYDLFRQVKHVERSERDSELVEKMSVVLVKLQALLKDWAFGDALLLKMVTINAFSVEWTQSKTLARAFLLKFGACLAERLELSLKKALEKKTLSLRLLMPLVLLSDHVATWNLDEDVSPDKALSTEAREFCQESKTMYWTRLASVATQLIPLRNSLGLDEMDDGILLKEYEQLAGFKPFESFCGAGAYSPSSTPRSSARRTTTRQSGDEVYLNVDDAIRVLELDESQSPKSTTEHENALKLKRFFHVVDAMVQKKQPVCCVNGQYRVFFNKSDAHYIVESDDDGGDVIMDDGESPVVDSQRLEQENETEKQPPPRIPLPVQEKKDDVLEYKPSEGGAGPALLVPGALLLNKSQQQDSSPPAAKPAAVVTTERPLMGTAPANLVQQQVLQSASASRPVVDARMEERSAPAPPAAAPLGPPPGLLPPPGFGGAPASTIATTPSLGAPLSSLQQQPPPPVAVGYAMYPPPPPSSAQQQQQALPDGDTVLEMLRGMDTNTANPFMTSSSVDNLFASQAGSSNDDTMEGMSLLDSSLLNSMMMDDGTSQPRSRNPFLT